MGMSYWAKSDDTLLPAPANPKFKVALCASYVTSHPAGGSDKLVNGHRFDTVAIANGLINAGMDVKIIFYTVEEHDRFFEVVAGFDAIVIRINPGQITANGGSQQKFDDKDFETSQQFLEEAADIRKRLAVVMDGSDEEYDAAFASAKQDTHNSKFG